MIQIISKKISERIKKWKKIFKILIDSKKNLIFVLNNKSKDLIENMTARIVVMILEEEEEEKEEFDYMNEDSN